MKWTGCARRQSAPDIGAVYTHYRGENLPDPQFLNNTLIDTFHIPADKLSEFTSVFLETLQQANLLEEHNGKQRVVDVSQDGKVSGGDPEVTRKQTKPIKADGTDTCFVMMPFEAPIGGYYTGDLLRRNRPFLGRETDGQGCRERGLGS